MKHLSSQCRIRFGYLPATCKLHVCPPNWIFDTWAPSQCLQIKASQDYENTLVFHIALLKPHKENPFPSQAPSHLPPMQTQGQEEFLVHHLLDSRMISGKLHYLVNWEGYSLKECFWESVSNVHALDLVKASIGLTLINLAPEYLEAALKEGKIL